VSCWLFGSFGGGRQWLKAFPRKARGSSDCATAPDEEVCTEIPMCIMAAMLIGRQTRLLQRAAQPLQPPLKRREFHCLGSAWLQRPASSLHMPGCLPSHVTYRRDVCSWFQLRIFW
jgi:hypothetical protein